MFTIADSIRSFHTVSALPGMSEANRKAVLEGYSRGLHGLIDNLLRAEPSEMRGSIRRRGVNSFELRFDLERVDGKRRSRSVAFKGTFKEAQKELSRLLAAADAGTLSRSVQHDGRRISPRVARQHPHAVPQDA